VKTRWFVVDRRPAHPAKRAAARPSGERTGGRSVSACRIRMITVPVRGPRHLRRRIPSQPWEAAIGTTCRWPTPVVRSGEGPRRFLQGPETRLAG